MSSWARELPTARAYLLCLVEEPRLSGEKTVSAGAVTDEGITEVVSVMDGATEEIRPPTGEEIIEESLVMDGTARVNSGINQTEEENNIDWWRN